MDMVKRATESYLASAEGPAAARLRFLEGLWAIQSGVEAAERAYEAPDAETAREALVTGQPLFLVSAPRVPRAEFLEVVAAIVEHVAASAGLPEEHVAALKAVDLAEVVTDERLATAAHAPDEFVADVARALGAGDAGPLTQATAAFVLGSALVPFLTGPSAAAREGLSSSDLRTWDSGRCPVCGSAAAMGRVGERSERQGGERTLWCGVCHAEWKYDRIRCVRCGTQKPDSLRYTYIEEDPAHRLHLCDECHGYARFVFEDDLKGPLSMIVEDVVSTTLDAVAESRGYTPWGDANGGA